MSFGERIFAWRNARGFTVDELADRSRLGFDRLAAVESRGDEPVASEIEALASALCVPPGWLHDDPAHVLGLADPTDGAGDEHDPLTAKILAAASAERNLYALLTHIVWSGEPRLVRAAEVALKSLIRQVPRTTVPWESRPAGHFEPPAD